MDRATIHYQEDRRRGANHQTLERFPNYFCVDRAVVRYETEFAARTECRDYAQQEAASRHFLDRRFTNERPRRSGVVVGTDSRFVRKADGCALRSGLGTNCGLERGLPDPHQCHVQLLRLVERLLRREAQQLHDPPDRGWRRLHAEFTLDQRHDPQAQGKLELQPRVVSRRFGKPGHILHADLRRAPRDRPGQQSVLTPIAKVRQPAKDALDIDARDRRDAGHILPFTNRLDGLLPHHLKRPIFALATVQSSVAFHANIVP